MGRLVFLAAHREVFVDSLRRAWDAGDVVAPVDPRLPPRAVRDLLERFGPTEVVDGDALVVATSGGTGEPKGVVLTHEAVRWAADATNTALSVDPFADMWLVQLPLAHVGGLGVLTRAMAWRTGFTFDPEDPATLTSAVPTQLERADHSRFRKVLVGGSADWRQRGPNVVRTYGLTESFGGVVYDGVPLPGVEVRVVDGEVHLRCGSLLRCDADGTVPLVDGWLPTGDEGTWDGERLSVLGRRGDVIVTGGEKVWPEPVERVLRTVDGVADVAIVGRPDDEWGAVVTAVVVPDGDPPTLEALRNAVTDLPRWCAPRRLELREQLPTTALGKVRRSAL